ncbi:MAG: TonB-dependent receptor domain-containing protein [Gemmatimonadales bacterium]
MHTFSGFRLCLLAVLLLVAPVASLSAQVTGRIVGRVVDASQGYPIAGADLEVVGAAITAVTALDGRFALQDVPVGPVSIRVRMLGFAPKVVTGLVVAAGKTVAQDISLSAAAVQLAEISVSAAAERGSVNRALDEQRNAPGIVSAVSAEQIERSPDSDAAQAVQRVSGVTVQDGKYVIVRGLGERYTTTSLNGARIPSPEPERKVVPLDLFPAALLEGITTSKTFTPDQPGDFSGAQVDLKTREFPAGRVFTMSTSVGVNTAVNGSEPPRAPRTGTEWRGLAGSERELPEPAVAAGNMAALSQTDRIPIINSFRDVWKDRGSEAGPNGSFGLSVGGEDPVFGQRFGYIGSFSYSYNQETRRNESRASAFPGPTPDLATPVNVYTGSTGRESVLWGGLLNLSTRLGAGTKLSFNNSLTRTGDNEATRLNGFYEQNAIDLDLTRLSFVERSVRSNQLKGEHLLGEQHFLDWSASATGVKRNEPDRSDLIYVAESDGAGGMVPAFWWGANRSADRTFSSIDEKGYEGGLNYRLSLGAVDAPTWLKAGVMGRTVDRDADSRIYNLSTTSLTETERRADAEDIFSGYYADQGRLFLNPGSSGRYDAEDRLVAGYLQADVPVTDRIRVLGGVRVERSQIDVNTVLFRGIQDSVVPSELRNTDILPAVGITYFINQNHQLRVSATQTLSRPEYRELSPVEFYDVLGGQRLFGNPDLQRALIQNYDARWEWYPRSGETISLGAFYKRFRNPIERILVQNADGFSPDITFANAEGADNYGLELEVRKRLDMLSQGLRRWTVFANGTLIQSEIDVGNEGLSSLTNPSRPMAGQSEYVVNAGLAYAADDGRWSGTLLYNVAGRRLAEAGISPLPDSYEQERHLLDFSLQFPLAGALSGRFDAENLLDEPVRYFQGPVERLRYETGRIFTMGLKWELR